MSFILDALRKSDARRRSEQGPPLPSDPMPMQRVRRRRLSGMTLASLILASIVLAGLTMRPEFVHRLMPREAAPLPATLNDLSVPQLPGEPAAVARAAPTEASTLAAEPERGPEGQPEVQPQIEQATEPAPVMAEHAVPELISPEPMVAEPMAATSAAAEPVDPEPADYLMFWELPLAVRQDIPPMTMNLHMFTTDEADRFVLINGQRRRQGERLPGGIEVVEIRPEGAILEANGHRFLLRR